MNTTPASVLPLKAIAFLFTPAQWVDMFGLDNAMDILQAQRQARSRREAIEDMAETPWFEPKPVRIDSMGSPVYEWQETP